MARNRGHDLMIRLQPPFTIGILPSPVLPWQVVPRDEGAERHSIYYVHQSLVYTLGLDADLAPLDAIIRSESSQLRRRARKSGRRALLLVTVFLPVLLIGARPFPTSPGSQYTQGQAIVGFLATLSIPGFLLAIITRSWVIAGLCAYWWLGTRVLQREHQYRGFNV